MLEIVKEALDEVALAIERSINRALDPDVALGRDMGLAAGLSNHLDDDPTIAAAICDQGFGWRQASSRMGAPRLV
jgi:hypothetical protein